MEEILTVPEPDQYEGKLIADMHFQKYLDLPEYMHSSDLKLLQQSVNHWLSKRDYPETKALLLGSLGHTMILEMDKLTERYLVMPKVDARTKAGKEQKMLAEEQANNEGKILISQDCIIFDSDKYLILERLIKDADIFIYLNKHLPNLKNFSFTPDYIDPIHENI